MNYSHMDLDLGIIIWTKIRRMITGIIRSESGFRSGSWYKYLSGSRNKYLDKNKENDLNLDLNQDPGINLYLDLGIIILTQIKKMITGTR